MKRIRSWLAVFFFAVSGISAFLYMREEIPYIQNSLSAKRLLKTYVKAESESREQTEPGADSFGGEPLWRPDFEGLRTLNPDIAGWIYIPGTQVNYPIMRHPSEDSYYLSHDSEKRQNKLGAIYMHHDAFFSDAHVILFGHNMKSGQMFGGLSAYADEEFAEKYPDVYIFLPDLDLHCIVYSAYICPADDLTYTVGYVTGREDYGAFIDHTLEHSCILPGVLPTDADQIITLSTCTDSHDAGRRFVVNCFPDQTNPKQN